MPGLPAGARPHTSRTPEGNRKTYARPYYFLDQNLL